jgi:hypothetical protein
LDVDFYFGVGSRYSCQASTWLAKQAENFRLPGLIFRPDRIH